MTPSCGVPKVESYHCLTRSKPSGFRQGIRSSTTLASTRRTRGSSLVARWWASSIDIWAAPTSVAWILHETATTVLASAISASALASLPTFRGSASLLWTSRRRSPFARLLGEEIRHSRNGLSSVVLPTSRTMTRSEPSSRMRKYSTIWGQSARRRASPTSKPRCSRGVMIDDMLMIVMPRRAAVKRPAFPRAARPLRRAMMWPAFSRCAPS